MFGKVCNLFQRAISHDRSPKNKHGVSSYSASMFHIDDFDVTDPSTHGILGDEHFEVDDDGNERQGGSWGLGSKLMMEKDGEHA